MSTGDESSITAEELAALLVESGHHHHQAYAATDGADPEWALWYAGYLQARLWERVADVPTRSTLVYLLIAAERAHTEDDGPWPSSYAAFMLSELTPNER